jgi:hypothetical protein
VGEASDFARWLNNSGLLEILKDRPQELPLPVDGSAPAAKLKALIEGCDEVYRKCGKVPPPEYAKTDIDEFRELLEFITKKLAA